MTTDEEDTRLMASIKKAIEVGWEEAPEDEPIHQLTHIKPHFHNGRVLQLELTGGRMYDLVLHRI